MIITAVISLAGLGLLLGAGLVIASRYLSVEVDPRVEKIQEELPGANCGGCGYPGCSGFAVAVVAGTAKVTDCAPGGKTTAEKIAAILGVDAGDVVEQVALVQCAGGNKAATRKSIYDGVTDCAAAELVGGGDKLCPYGCLGLGSCVTACPFGAVVITPDRLAVVDADKCTGCGKCVAACPRHIIRMVPKAAKVHVLCQSKDKAKVVKAYCTVGCTACKLCAKQSKAFDVATGLSVMQYDSDAEIPETASFVCASQTIFDGRLYDLFSFVGDPKVREDLTAKAEAYKEEQKKAKEAKRAKKDKPEKEEKADKADKAEAPEAQEGGAA